jgi:class 3 adenylate cyclase/pimeloyl-ACP methyl ester carboxylesterase
MSSSNKPKVQYARTDDAARIAYWKQGTGQQLVFTQYHPFSHILVELENETNAGIYRRLAQHFAVVRYDGRGVGLSRTDDLDFSFDARTRDLEAVFAAAVTEPAVLIGMGGGGPVAIRYCAENPLAVTHLVLYDTTAKFPISDPTPGNTAVRALADALAKNDLAYLARSWAAINGADPDWYSRYVTKAITAEALIKARESAYDSRDYLQRIACPTLVIHEQWPGEHSRQSEELATSIAGSSFAILERNQDDPWQDFADFSNEVFSFLGIERADEASVEAPNRLFTVLFTDLVGHTEMMSRLGDERGRAVLREHETITREVLKAHGGTEVKTMGDGFMASFGSVTKAVECAIALQRAFADHDGEPLNVRVGLNAGEPIEEDGDLFGATVILASRIAAKAGAGEILVADTVRGLCSGKGFLFADRGEFVAKGFEEPVRVYEVSWRR